MNHVDNTLIHKNGFTLIELMLAMSFVAGLLVAIALTVIQISNIYNRGITLKEINQAGRSLSSDVQRSITSTSSFTIENVAGSKYIDRSWGGRLCLGQYSYVWNYGKALFENNPNINTYNGSAAKINFVKVADPNGTYCADTAKRVDETKSTELLNVGDRTLAIHAFDIVSEPSATDTATQQRLYTLDFVIGTNLQSALSVDQKSCLAPGQTGSDTVYCSVQAFTVVARAGNKP